MGLAVSPQLVLLDNVQCAGNETSLLECARNPLGDHNCDQFSGAGVRCGGEHRLQHCAFWMTSHLLLC